MDILSGYGYRSISDSSDVYRAFGTVNKKEIMGLDELPEPIIDIIYDYKRRFERFERDLAFFNHIISILGFHC